MAGRLEELRCALPVEHHVAEPDPDGEPAAGELGHLQSSALIVGSDKVID